MGKKKETIIEQLHIVEAVSDGLGLGRDDGRVVLVEGAIPGDVVDAAVRRKHKGTLIAQIVQIRLPSAHRVRPVCQHFGHCGGCKWQMMHYPQQLTYKQKQTEDALNRIAGIALPKANPIIGAQATYYYRNKVEYSFSDNRWLTREEIAGGERYATDTLGFHVPSFFDKVLEINRCHLHQDRLNAIRNELLAFAKAQSVPFHNIKAHRGFLRNLVFRTSEASGEVMLILITGEDNPQFVELVFSHLRKKFDWVTEWVWIHNPKQNDSYSELPYNIWRGKGYITEVLGGKQFRIGPVSFFQTNTQQAERLYGVVRQMLGTGVELLYDLYCGTGTIGIYCSDVAHRIVGLEYVPQSVQDAALNAELNHLQGRTTFVAGDIAKLLTPSFVQAHGMPCVVVTDPPRNGMEAPVLRQLLEMRAPKIVYVSCKPSTQARDLAQLASAYAVAALQPVDMFPQTTHVENVAMLEIKP